jgi:hypothetical protein
MSSRRDCPFCGEALDPGERFCARCGNQYPFDDEGMDRDPVAPTRARMARPVASPWYRTVPFLLGVVLLVVLLGYGLFRFGVTYLEARRPDPASDPAPVVTASANQPAASPATAASPGSVLINPSPAATGPRVRVANTGGQGANLRQSPSTTAPVVKSLADGASLEVVGADQEAEGRTWRNVRDSAGATGWMAAELLQPE